MGGAEDTSTRQMEQCKESGKDYTPPVGLSDTCVSSSSDSEGLDAATACYEIVKSCVMAAVTLCVLVFMGARVAIPFCLAMYVISRRFASELDSRTPGEKNRTATGSLKGEVPADFDRINWVQLSRLIPGLDAERLKETFEYLYGRISRGTLKVKKNGEWEEIRSSHTKGFVTCSSTKEGPLDMNAKKNQ